MGHSFPVSGVPEISGEDVFQKLQNSESFFLIDIREPSEIEETGIISGALCIPMSEISEESLKNKEIQKQDLIILLCWSGYRSSVVCNALINAGYSSVKSVTGGMQAWLLSGKKTELFQRNPVSFEN